MLTPRAPVPLFRTSVPEGASAHRGHFGAISLCYLDRERAYASRGSVDQHTLPSSRFRHITYCMKRRRSRHWDGRCLGHRKIGRNGRQSGFARRREFGAGAAAASEYGVPHGKTRHGGADGRDDSCQVVARYAIPRFAHPRR